VWRVYNICFVTQSIVSAGGHASDGSSRAGTPDGDVFDNSSRSETPDGDDVPDDCEIVEETQAAKFADECIVSPVSGKKESVVKKAGKALKRSLAVEFEEVAAAEKKHVLKAVKIEKE
jgi:hypothetical protein